MMSIVARLEELPTPMWMALAILGVVLWWPLGLAVLAYILWSGRMRCCQFGFSRWKGPAHDVGQPEDWLRRSRTSGNRAFDEYRAETLRRLEEEHLPGAGPLECQLAVGRRNVFEFDLVQHADRIGNKVSDAVPSDRRELLRAR